MKTLTVFTPGHRLVPTMHTVSSFLLLCAAVFVLRLLLKLAHPPRIGGTMYISVPTTERHARLLEWIDREGVPAPMHVPGVIMDTDAHAAAAATGRVPPEIGHAGVRQAHINALQTIAFSKNCIGWFLVVEDDVVGSYADAAWWLHWLHAVAPGVEVINLYSPGWWCVFPAMGTRTTAYWVTCVGAGRVLAMAQNSPARNLDIATQLHLDTAVFYLRHMFLRAWVVPRALGAAENGDSTRAWVTQSRQRHSFDHS